MDFQFNSSTTWESESLLRKKTKPKKNLSVTPKYTNLSTWFPTGTEKILETNTLENELAPREAY